MIVWLVQQAQAPLGSLVVPPAVALVLLSQVLLVVVLVVVLVVSSASLSEEVLGLVLCGDVRRLRREFLDDI